MNTVAGGQFHSRNASKAATSSVSGVRVGEDDRREVCEVPNEGEAPTVSNTAERNGHAPFYQRDEPLHVARVARPVDERGSENRPAHLASGRPFD